MTLLVFDCDGVLVDSEPIANEILARTLTSLGRPMSAAESMRTQVGKSLVDILRETREITGRHIPDDVGAAMNRELFARLRTDLRAMDGVREALAALPQPRCVASSSVPERIALALETTGLAPFFERCFSAVEVRHGKPAPDLFLHAARALRSAPGDCIVIEDSVAGARAAAAAGMRCIGFTGGGHANDALAARLTDAGAAIVISHMRDLPDAVARLC
ncbi:MAG: HAD-IA family hydrolase [Hyphomicrobiales bacterium]|nr:HAD-IA family hydrolase [Hyphomicrobiales bacterium]